MKSVGGPRVGQHWYERMIRPISYYAAFHPRSTSVVVAVSNAEGFACCCRAADEEWIEIQHLAWIRTFGRYWSTCLVRPPDDNPLFVCLLFSHLTQVYIY